MEVTGTSRGSPADLGIPKRLVDGDAPHTNDVVWGTRTDCLCAPGAQLLCPLHEAAILVKASWYRQVE
jgi:hypothetical protein